MGVGVGIIVDKLMFVDELEFGDKHFSHWGQISLHESGGTNISTWRLGGHPFFVGDSGCCELSCEQNKYACDQT